MNTRQKKREGEKKVRRNERTREGERERAKGAIKIVANYIYLRGQELRSVVVLDL